MDEGPKRDRQRLNKIGIALATLAIIGILLDRAHLYVWVFILAFGLAPLPERAYRNWRARRDRRT